MLWFRSNYTEDKWDSDSTNGCFHSEAGKTDGADFFWLHNLSESSAAGAANAISLRRVKTNENGKKKFCSTAAPARGAATAHHRASRLRRHKSAVTAPLLQILSSSSLRP